MTGPTTEAAQPCAQGHDFTDPVVVRQGPHLLHASVEVAVSLCRRCGKLWTAGWTGEE